MDSIKIIKKHGQPGGLPTVTAYVAEDAPGEAGAELYNHVLDFGGLKFCLVTNEGTVFTTASLAKYLYDNNFKSSSRLFPAASSDIIAVADDIYTSYTQGLYSSNGTTLVAVEKRKSLSIVDGVLTLGTASDTSGSIGLVRDTVIEL